MIAVEDLILAPIDDLQDIHGVQFPEEPKFRQFLITGPPGSGKSRLLREVMELYNRGGDQNPHLDPKIQPLNLTEAEIDALIAMMEALEGEGYQDTAPTAFPQ